MMWSRKQIVLFLAKSIVIYSVLLASWPLVSDVYGYTFRTIGESIFSPFDSLGIIHFEKNEVVKRDVDTIVLFGDPAAGEYGFGRPMDSGDWSFAPSVLVVSLILATPISWSRRFLAIPPGVAVVNAFVLLKLTLVVVYGVSMNKQTTLFTLTPSTLTWLDNAIKVLCSPTVTCFGVPLPAWILASLRRNDLFTPQQTMQPVPSAT